MISARREQSLQASLPGVREIRGPFARIWPKCQCVLHFIAKKGVQLVAWSFSFRNIELLPEAPALSL